VHDSKIQDTQIEGRDSRAKEKFFTLIETQKDPRPAYVQTGLRTDEQNNANGNSTQSGKNVLSVVLTLLKRMQANEAAVYTVTFVNLNEERC
jgi:hypothetical protein